MRTLKLLLAILVLLVVAAGLYIWSGIYPIGADVPHWSITNEILETFRDRSIAKHARSVQVPVIDTAAQIAEGADHYNEMCKDCHLSPGVTTTEIRAGLYPQPPDLTQPSDLTPAEMFWIIKHGVKLTAMPAWGKTHSDQKIWAIVGFVRKLPGMTPEQYKTLTASASDHHDDDAAGQETGAGHDHGPDAGDDHHGDEGGGQKQGG